MGQILHGNATTTQVVRAAIQRSQASLAQLNKELGNNPKALAKGRKRATIEDLKTGPKEPRSTVKAKWNSFVDKNFTDCNKYHTLQESSAQVEASAEEGAQQTKYLSNLGERHAY